MTYIQTINQEGEVFFFIRKKDIRYFYDLEQKEEKDFTPEFSDEYLEAVQRISLMAISPEQKKRMIYAYSLLEKKRANPISDDDFFRNIEVLSNEAQQNGLTPDILDSILHAK